MSSDRLTTIHGHPAHVHDVDHHQRVVLGKVDDAVVGRVVGAVPRELDPLAADLEGPAIAEGLLRCRSGRVVVPEQEPPGLLVPDPHDVLAEERGRAGVVRVMVGVDQVGHLVAHAVGSRDLVDRSLEVVPDARRGIEQDDAVLRRQEGGLVDAVGDPVEVPLDAPDVVALLVEAPGRTTTAGIGRVVGQGVGRFRRCWSRCSCSEVRHRITPSFERRQFAQGRETAPSWLQDRRQVLERPLLADLPSSVTR